MRWGLIGGGQDSQIGGAHRVGAQMDGLFTLAAGALDIDPERSRAFGLILGLTSGRAYGDWREMLGKEADRTADRLDLVTVATPNNTHWEIAKSFLEAGFHVLCEKPLAMTVAEADDLAATSRRTGRICATNFGYSGYPMAIQAREMIRRGDLGDIRVVCVEFAHGFHAAGDDSENPRVRWRYDPEQAGASSVVADAGVHGLHMAQFLTGQRITEISAQFERCVAGRELEDDALLACRFERGAVGRLWFSAVATGQAHGFGFRVFGSRGGLRWRQEFPNQLHYSPIGAATCILERGDPSLYPDALAAGRIAMGHAEGMHEAFGNIYKAIHADIAGRRGGGQRAGNYPTAEAGADMVRAVHASVQSAKRDGAWVKLGDP